MRADRAGTRWVLAVALLGMILTVGGCASTKVHHAYGLDINFTDLKSYQWAPASASARVPGGQVSLIETNVQFMADQELQQKGFLKSSDHPDFLITVVQDRQMDRSPSYRLKSLTLSMFRTADRALVWQGTASGAIDIDPDSGELRQAVQDILAKFPIFPAAPVDVQLAEKGFALIQQGNYAEAEKSLDEALTANPENPYALLNLGVVYQNTERPEKARETYGKLIALDPPDVAVLSDKSGAQGKRLTDIARENLQTLP